MTAPPRLRFHIVDLHCRVHRLRSLASGDRAGASFAVPVSRCSGSNCHTRWIRYFTPELPAFETFHSNCSSKSRDDTAAQCSQHYGRLAAVHGRLDVPSPGPDLIERGRNWISS